MIPLRACFILCLIQYQHLKLNPWEHPHCFRTASPYIGWGAILWRVSACLQVNWGFGCTDMNLWKLFQHQQQLLSVCAAETKKPVNETLWILELQLAVLKMMKSYEVVRQSKASRRQPKIWFCNNSVRKTDWEGNFAQQGLPAGRESLFGETRLHCVDCSTFSYLELLHKEKRGVCKKP